MAGLNDNLDKANKLLKQISEKYKELREENPFKNVDPGVIAKSETEIKKLEDSLKGLTARVEDLNHSLSDTYNAWQSIVNESKGAKNAINQYNNILSSSASISRQIRDHNQGTSMLSEKQLKTLKQKLNSKKSDLKSSVDELKTQKKALIDQNIFGNIDYKQKKKNRDLIKNINEQINLSKSALKEGVGLYDQELSRVEELQKHHKEINKELGFAPQLAAGLDNMLKKMGLPDLGVADALTEAKELGLEAKAQGKDFDTMAHFTGKMKNNFMGAFTKANLLQGAVLGLINGFIQSQKGIGDLAKGLGMSAERASDMRMGFAQIANSSGNINVSVKGLQESQMAIGKALGTNVKLNKEDLETMTDIVKKTGLQHDELVGIQKLSLATGKSLDDNVEAALGGATAYAMQNKMVIDNNKVLREVNNASNALKLSLGGSVEALGEAVVKVQQLGMDLKTAEQIANSMLNFESSIEAELEAELLTGKNLNLERARQLALEGDIAGAAKEVADQLGNAEEFGKMNVIQQEALAKSVGMNREQLAGMLIERQALAAMNAEEGESALQAYQRLKDENLTQEEIKKKIGEKAMAQLEQQSAQEKFNATVEKLKEIFTQVGDALAPAFNILADMFGLIQLILVPVQALFDFFGMIGSKISAIIGPLGKVGKVLKGLAGLAIVFAAYKTFAAVSGALAATVIGGLAAPIVGAAAAAGVTAAGFGLLSGIKTADDMVSPGEGPSGYGKRTLLGPEGAIQLNDRDTVIAGVKLFGDDVKSEPGKPTQMAGAGEIKVGGASVDMTQTNALLNKIAILLSQPSVLTLDNNKLGEATKTQTSKVE